eukprot:Hpha_TRINITY_DN15680_c3_g11::TRINITY_DN15680_c3_g11_i1::g.99944::m.99944
MWGFMLLWGETRGILTWCWLTSKGGVDGQLDVTASAHHTRLDGQDAGLGGETRSALGEPLHGVGAAVELHGRSSHRNATLHLLGVAFAGTRNPVKPVHDDHESPPGRVTGALRRAQRYRHHARSISGGGEEGLAEFAVLVIAGYTVVLVHLKTSLPHLRQPQVEGQGESELVDVLRVQDALGVHWDDRPFLDEQGQHVQRRIHILCGTPGVLRGLVPEAVERSGGGEIHSTGGVSGEHRGDEERGAAHELGDGGCVVLKHVSVRWELQRHRPHRGVPRLVRGTRKSVLVGCQLHFEVQVHPHQPLRHRPVGPRLTLGVARPPAHGHEGGLHALHLDVTNVGLHATSKDTINVSANVSHPGHVGVDVVLHLHLLVPVASAVITGPHHGVVVGACPGVACVDKAPALAVGLDTIGNLLHRLVRVLGPVVPHPRHVGLPDPDTPLHLRGEVLEARAAPQSCHDTHVQQLLGDLSHHSQVQRPGVRRGVGAGAFLAVADTAAVTVIEDLPTKWKGLLVVGLSDAESGPAVVVVPRVVVAVRVTHTETVDRDHEGAPSDVGVLVKNSGEVPKHVEPIGVVGTGRHPGAVGLVHPMGEGDWGGKGVRSGLPGVGEDSVPHNPRGLGHTSGHEKGDIGGFLLLHLHRLVTEVETVLHPSSVKPLLRGPLGEALGGLVRSRPRQRRRLDHRVPPRPRHGEGGVRSDSNASTRTPAVVVSHTPARRRLGHRDVGTGHRQGSSFQQERIHCRHRGFRLGAGRGEGRCPYGGAAEEGQVKVSGSTNHLNTSAHPVHIHRSY